MRASALLFAVDVSCTFLAPSDGILHVIAYAVFPLLAVIYLWARGKARPGEEFKDTSWGS